MVNIEVNSERWFNLEDLPNELWKPIRDFEGLYDISNYGRVKTLPGVRKSKRYYKNGILIKCKILKVIINKHGYANTQLWVNDEYKSVKIHRLVAEAFIPNPENKPQVNHINGIKTDNRVENLEWCTNGENGKHAWDNKLRTKRFGKDNYASKPVLQISLDGNIIKKWDSINDVVRALNANHGCIINCCKNRYGFKTHKGFKWKYAEEVEKNGMEILGKQETNNYR